MGTHVSDLVPETHRRSFGQPTAYSHPYLMSKDESMQRDLALIIENAKSAYLLH